MIKPKRCWPGSEDEQQIPCGNDNKTAADNAFHSRPALLPPS